MKKLSKYGVALLVVILVHCVVLLKSSFFPYPELFIYPYLTNLGLTPYSQILDQHFPGLMFFPVNLGNLGFYSPLLFRFLQIGIVFVGHLFIYKLGERLTRNKKAALLGNLLFFVIHPFLEGNVLWIDSFVPILLLPALYLLNQRRGRSIFAAGLLIGLAILMKQVAIPLGVIIFLWVWRQERSLGKYYLAGLAVPLSFLVLFVLRKGIVSDFVYWTYTFNVETFAQMGRKHATLRQMLAIGVIYLPAVSVALFDIVHRRKVLLVSLLMLATLLFAYARFDYVHLQPSLPFAILALVHMFSKLPKLDSFVFVYLLPVIWVATRFYLGNAGQEVRYFGDVEHKVAGKVLELTEENDPIFMFGTLPHMYQMTLTRPPGDVFVFHFPWFMKIAEERILAGIREEPPKVVVRQPGASIDSYDIYEHMPDIEKYISEKYEKIYEVDGIEILIPYEDKHR